MSKIIILRQQNDLRILKKMQEAVLRKAVDRCVASYQKK